MSPPSSVIPVLLAAAERFRPDLIVYEGMNAGAGVAASVLDVPAAAFAIGLAPFVYGSAASGHGPPPAAGLARSGA